MRSGPYRRRRIGGCWTVRCTTALAGQAGGTVRTPDAAARPFTLPASASWRGRPGPRSSTTSSLGCPTATTPSSVNAVTPQRLAILKDPAILVLDEATSHLDSLSEQLIQAQCSGRCHEPQGPATTRGHSWRDSRASSSFQRSRRPTSVPWPARGATRGRQEGRGQPRHHAQRWSGRTWPRAARGPCGSCHRPEHWAVKVNIVAAVHVEHLVDDHVAAFVGLHRDPHRDPHCSAPTVRSRPFNRRRSNRSAVTNMRLSASSQRSSAVNTRSAGRRGSRHG